MEISLPVNQLYLPDYETEKSRCTDFVTGFEDPTLPADAIHGKMKYMRQMVSLLFLFTSDN